MKNRSKASLLSFCPLFTLSLLQIYPYPAAHATLSGGELKRARSKRFVRSALIALGRDVISSSTSVKLPVSPPADVQEHLS